MEIKKGNINLCEQAAKGFSGALVEGDIIVPDTKPDMAEILVADAKVKVRAEECAGGMLTVKGEVLFTVLYIPEEEETVRSLEQILPFIQNIELKCSDCAEYKVDAVVEHIGFTLVNSRKLSAKVMVGLTAEATIQKEYEPIIEACGDDMESRSKKYSIYVPLSETQTEISVSDILTVPQDKPDIGEILKLDAYITPSDVKVMNGKAMIHAEMHINTVYSASPDGELVGVNHIVPFTDVVEAPGADEQSAVNVSYKLLDIFATGKGDLKGDTKIISIDANIGTTVKVSRTISEKIVDDCYFMNAKADMTRENMKICEYITSENTRVPVHTRVEAPKNVKIKEVIECCAKPLVRECTWENGMATVNGSLVINMIYRDDSGALRNAVSENDLNWQKPIAEKCDIDADVWTESVNWEAQEEGIQVFCNIGIYTKALKPCRVEIITDIQKQEENMEKQPGMVVYFAKKGDNLWSVAKKYRTKMEKIKNANNIEGEKIEAGRRLLIPKV